jgi:hypothetical protein
MQAPFSESSGYLFPKARSREAAKREEFHENHKDIAAGKRARAVEPDRVSRRTVGL